MDDWYDNDAMVGILIPEECEEYTVTVCCACDGVVNEVSSGDEGWSVCEDCGTVEGETEELTEAEYEARMS